MHILNCILNVRARFMVENTIYNVHLFAIPLFQSHTGENTFATTCKFFDSLYPLWKETLIVVSSDGYLLMTGWTQGLLTRIGRVTSHIIICLWCGLHQLDLVMQRVSITFTSVILFIWFTKANAHVGTKAFNMCHQAQKGFCGIFVGRRL